MGLRGQAGVRNAGGANRGDSRFAKLLQTPRPSISDCLPKFWAHPPLLLLHAPTFVGVLRLEPPAAAPAARACSPRRTVPPGPGALFGSRVVRRLAEGRGWASPGSGKFAQYKRKNTRRNSSNIT